MSEKPRAVSSEHFVYLAARTIPEDDFLRALEAEAARAGLPDISISAEQGAFLEILLRAAGARRVVEVGTLAGATAIRFGRAVGPDGHVTTIEVDPKHAAFARAQIARSDVADRVDVVEGDAREVLAGLPDASADAAFIDADKESYSHYLRECVRIVRPGGLVLVDNAFAFGRLFDANPERATDVAAVRAINDEIAAHSELTGIIVPFGDGCWVAVRDG